MKTLFDSVNDNYPKIFTYLSTPDVEQPQLVKLITIVLYLRRMLGLHVSEDEIFSDKIHTIDKEVFADVKDTDKQKVLDYIILIACLYIEDKNFIDELDKKSIINRLIAYSK